MQAPCAPQNTSQLQQPAHSSAALRPEGYVLTHFPPLHLAFLGPPPQHLPAPSSQGWSRLANEAQVVPEGLGVGAGVGAVASATVTHLPLPGFMHTGAGELQTLLMSYEPEDVTHEPPAGTSVLPAC